MIFHFILNPKSGRSKKHKNMEQAIKDACKSRQINYHIYYTTCPGDATEYVRSMIRISSEKQRFICVGGDGSISEIVNSAPCNPNVEFGVIPRGSGNDFARNFSNHKNFTNIDALIDGEAIPLDLIKCNNYYCVNMVNIGFDCSVVKEAEKIKKIKFISSGISYILGVIVALFKPFGTKMKLFFDDGEVIEDQLTLTGIGNGKFCGGGFKTSPMALLNDGIMDICIVKKISRLTFISLVSKYKKGTFLGNKRAMKILTYKRVPHFKMEFENPIPICIDGEIKGAKNIDFSVVRNAFNFVVPKGSELLYKYEETEDKETLRDGEQL